MLNGGIFTATVMKALVICCLLFITGCSKENEPIVSNGGSIEAPVEAPETADKEFKFYKDDNFNWSFKVLPASDPTCSVILINSSTAQVNGTGNFYYKKIGETQASVSCFFMTRIAIGGNVYGQWNQYEITLTFLSAHHGEFEGKQFSSPEDDGEPIYGMFVYDSDKEIEDFINEFEEDDVDEPFTPSSISISEPEVSNITETSAKVSGTVIGEDSFSERGFVYSYRPSPTIENPKVTGNDIISSIITIAKGTRYYVRMYAIINGKVYYGKEVSFIAKGEKLKNFKLTRSYCSPTCAVLTVERPVEYGSYGLCWNTSPNPKVTDYYSDEVRDTGNPNQVDKIHIRNLNPDFNYFVRPYHIDKKGIAYYDEEILLTPYKEMLSVDILFDTFVPYEYNQYKPYDPMGVINNLRFKINWNNLPTKICRFEMWGWDLVKENIRYEHIPYPEFYVDNSKGEKTVNIGNTEVLVSAAAEGQESTKSIGIEAFDSDNNRICKAYYKLYVNRKGEINFTLSDYHLDH